MIKQRRIFKIFLFVMALTFTLTAFAFKSPTSVLATEQEISTIAITDVVLPAGNQNVNFSYKIDPNAGYTTYSYEGIIASWVLMEKYTDYYFSLNSYEYTICKDGLLWSWDKDSSQFSTFDSDRYYSFVLHVVPKTGYKFADKVTVTINGEPAGFSLGNDYSVAYATYNTFSPKSIAVNGGSCDKQTVKVGDSVTVTANMPDVGKVFDGWVCEGVELTSEQQIASNLTFIMPNENVTLTAKFIDHVPHTATDFLKNENEHYKTCSVCGEEYDKAKHDFSWVIVKDATFKVDGEKYEKCSVCGYTRNENTVIDALTYKVDIKENVAEVTLSDDLSAGVGIKNILQEITDKTVEIKVADKGSIAFNKSAVSQLAGGDATLVIKEGKVDDYDCAILVLETYVDGNILSFSGDARATVCYEFSELVPEGKVAALYCVDGDEKTEIDATFSNGKVTFETNKIATFIVEYLEERVETMPSLPEKVEISGGVIACIVIGGVALFGIGAYLVYRFIFKKKS